MKISKLIFLAFLITCFGILEAIGSSVSKTNTKKAILAIQPEEVKEVRVEVFDGLTMNELIEKLNRYLSSNLSGKGEIFANHAIELGLDPYLAVAVSMHETGCKWGCSSLMIKCNNVGGQKGKPSCNGSSYMAYSTLDEGIIGFMDNLYYNYVVKGLTTPEEINTKYAADPKWSNKINKYITEIKGA